MATEFGELVRKLRLRAGIGLRRFAALIGELPSNWSSIEHGRTPPRRSPEKLREIADALGLREGTDNWDRLFNSATRTGSLPADIEHMASRKLVPVLLR